MASASRVPLDQVDADQPVGAIVPVDVEGGAMAAIHTVAGWVLTADRCPHANCPFTQDGELADDGTLICNCHGSEFDAATGELRLGPALTGIDVEPLETQPKLSGIGSTLRRVDHGEPLP